jgi:hypothetical protein
MTCKNQNIGVREATQKCPIPYSGILKHIFVAVNTHNSQSTLKLCKENDCGPGGRRGESLSIPGAVIEEEVRKLQLCPA